MGFDILNMGHIKGWGILSVGLVLRNLRKIIVTLSKVEMPMLPWKVVEAGTKRLSKVGMLEWMYFARLSDPGLCSK